MQSSYSGHTSGKVPAGLPVTNSDAKGLPTWAKQTVRANICSWRIFVRTKKGKEKGPGHLTRLAFVVIINSAVFFLSLHVCEWECVVYVCDACMGCMVACSHECTHGVRVKHQVSSSALLH